MEGQGSNRNIPNQSVLALDFPFDPYDDIVLVTGKKKSGKSYFAKRLSSYVSRVIIWDYNWEHKAPQNNDWFKQPHIVIVHRLQDLRTAWFSFNDNEPRTIIYQPYDKSQESFNAFCSYINQFVIYCCVYIEELQNVTTAVSIPKSFSILMDSGRHRKIGLLMTTRSNKFIPTRLIDSADYIFMFKQQRVESYDYMKNYIDPDQVEALKQAPDYWYICYNGKHSGKTYLCKPIVLNNQTKDN